VSQQNVSVHFNRFPFKERQKILKSLAFELEDEIPLDIDEAIFDAKIVEYAGPFADVLTVAVPKEAVQGVLNIAKDGNFDPEIVSVEGLALANVFENIDAAPPERAVPLQASDESPNELEPARKARLILQLGHTRSNLLVYREGTLVGLRSIQWGGTEIVDNIMAAFGVPVFEAVKVLQERSFILMNSAGATKDQILLSTTIAKSVDLLLSDLRLVLLEIRTSFNVEYERIDLTGGVGQIQNLGAYLTQMLEIPSNVIKPFENSRQVRFETNARVEAVSLVAVGLALEGVKRPRNPAINLRKEEFARENEALIRFWETWKLPAQVALAAFVLFFAYAITRDIMAAGLAEKAEVHVSDMGKKVAGLKGAAASESGVRGRISTLRKQVRDREALEKAENLNSAMDILAKISEQLPVVKPPAKGAGITVSRIDIDNEDVTIEGRIAGGRGVTSVESVLKEISKSKAVQKVQGAATGTGEGVPFAYKFKVDRTRM
ncbi:MAG: pilus assembly protein PilM, partial [Proteobacteria bacterium]